MLLGALAMLAMALGIAWGPETRASVVHAGVPPCTAIPSGLVSWWDANGDYEDIVSGFHGTPQGSVSTTAGYIGDAFSFERDNAGDSIAVGNPVELASLSAGVTLEAWINLESIPSTGQTADLRPYGVISKWNQTAGGDSYGLNVTNNGAGATLAGGIGNGVSDPGILGGALSVSTWHHVAMTYDTTTDLNKLYLDGVEVGSRTRANGILASSVGVSIGRETGGATPRYFDGLIDDARVYNRALSGAELDAIHDNGTNGMCEPPPPPACTSAPSDLISWWPGNNSAEDIVSGLDGALKNGATFGTGEVGAAFDLERSASQYVEIGSPAELNSLPNGITIEAWVKLESAPAPNSGSAPQMYAVLSKWNQTIAGSAYGLYVANIGGTIRILGGLNDGSTGDSGFSGGVVTVGSWYHVAMTYDTTTDANKLFVNGVEVASRTRANGIITSAVLVMIGRENSGIPRYMDGRIDDARVYGRALSGSELSALYASGTGGVCSGPGSITIRKETQPDGAAQTFDFTGDVAGTIGDGATLTSGPIAAGTYTVTETLPPSPWGLQEIDCNDSDSTGNVSTRTATINVGTGESVECVFTNGELVLQPPDWLTTDNRWCKAPNPDVWVPVSTTPCGGLTQALPFGSQTNVDGAAKLSSGVGRAFPYYWTADSFFPPTGDFVMTLRMKYDSLQPHGTGVAFLKWDDATPVGTNTPYSTGAQRCAAWSVWGGSGGASYSFAGRTLGVPSPTAYHTFKMIYIDSANPLGGQYLLFVDGVLRIGPVRTTVRANRAWAGNHVFTNWTSTDWTDFTIQALNVTQPAVIDANNNSIDDRSESFPPTNVGANTQVDTDSDGLPDHCDPSTTPAPPGTIIIRKETIPDGSARPFTFSGAVSGTIVDGQTLTATLSPGSYNVTEAVTTAWNVLNIDCDDGDSSVDNAARTATIELGQAEAVTCVFNNDCTGAGDADCDGFLDPAVTSHTGPANTSLTLDNCPGVFNPAQTNTDGNFADQTPPSTKDDKSWAKSDAQGDACDTDDDNDGLDDTVESAGPPCASASTATDPLNRDTDNDKVIDGAECTLGTDPADSGSKPTPAACGGTADPDGDKLTTAVEVCGYGTNPAALDSDGDGALDGAKDGCEAASVNDDRGIMNSADQLLLGAAISAPFYVVSMDINKDGSISSGDQLLMAALITPPGQCP
jgi:hypothetical protein